jgi:hypothetical protein
MVAAGRVLIGLALATFALAPTGRVDASGIDIGGEAAQPAQRIPNPLQVIPIDCLPDTSAASLGSRLRERMGPLLGFDNPKLVPLGGDRTLWLLSDSFADLTQRAAPPLRHSDYEHNTLMLQDGSCFSLVQRVAGGLPWEFAPSHSPGDWFWPLGGSLGAGGLLYVFWSRMIVDNTPTFLDGIVCYPTETWLGVYDPATFRTISFGPAPNSGVSPQYGSAVQTAPDGYSYLFGNSNMLDLSREGGYGQPTPYTGTRMYLARVAAGHFADPPQFFTGTGWSADAGAAAPYSSRWSISNAMQPRLIDGTWYSAVKQDEFWGDRLLIEQADAPQGPWRTVADVAAQATLPSDRPSTWMTTYQPEIMPSRAPDGTLTVVLSQNAAVWTQAVDDPRLYRPRVLAIDA